MQPFTKFFKEKIRIAPTISAKGEIGEIRNGLVSSYPQTRKDAIKTTIKQMTLGKDMSKLFPDIVKNIATNDIEQKKLVYLYVLNYADIYPELCILIVNTFVTDSRDPNPLIRSMAIKTMSMIKTQTIVDYIEEPLRRTLQDNDPYVRKSAVFCVAKLFKINKDICLKIGVIDDLISMVSNETNSNVLADLIISLLEIIRFDSTENSIVTKKIDIAKLIKDNLKKFLRFLPDCNEWTRVTLLDIISRHNAKDKPEAKMIIKATALYLSNNNATIIMNTIKIILNNLKISGQENNETLLKKIRSSVLSLLNYSPEIQYVILKNVNIIVTKYPNLLLKDYNVFLIHDIEPTYIKLEKIKILPKLIDKNDSKQTKIIINELMEYCRDFELDIALNSIKSLIEVVIKSGNTKYQKNIENYLISMLMPQDIYRDECLIGICNLIRYFRAATDSFELSEDLINFIIQDLDEPEIQLIDPLAKSNYLWLLSEYYHTFQNTTIENGFNIEEKLKGFLNNFNEEEDVTQFNLLITSIKLYFQLANKSLIHNVVNKCLTDSISVDLKDISIIYDRILKHSENLNDFRLINELVSNTKLPQINTSINQLNEELVNILIKELGSITSIYYLNPNKIREAKQNTNLEDIKHLKSENMDDGDDLLIDLDDNDNSHSNDSISNTNNNTNININNNANKANFNNDIDLLAL
ncbi:hypothetical protein TBLA_0H00410 [Henningerozyma blattae CBS 6284]|uniref:AP complex subunit beta n=1 Tax=Henningerozyma blattae (strain ATCC 34711 / CBS 6284 / DSM 70876 / NBRC 10599 / NRRL Y-10934 / UCD 77-7) TaxID=1071380 RepID=I2H7I2_HENB6|nr:hypothetical protein TBLA_0H00410 [Tetrapisispora blattae CBS 6284]CCH62334.1 hypothetical protein TBLA_0H00410 [Tetrapisispora blattae CBS 6284]